MEKRLKEDFKEVKAEIRQSENNLEKKIITINNQVKENATKITDMEKRMDAFEKELKDKKEPTTKTYAMAASMSANNIPSNKEPSDNVISTPTNNKNSNENEEITKRKEILINK